MIKLKSVKKELPLHTFKAHPAAKIEDTNRHFLWAVVFLVVVMAVSFSLMFTGEIVGRAIDSQAAAVNKGGLFLVSPAEFTFTAARPSFTLPVKVNIGSAKSVALGFNLSYDASLLSADCSNIFNSLDAKFRSNTEDFTILRNFTCDEGLVSFSYGGICKDASCSNALTRDETIAEIIFSLNNQQAGTANFYFPYFEVVGFDTFANIIQAQETDASPATIAISYDATIIAPEEPETTVVITPTSGGGGGRRCESSWACADWSICNSALQQTRTCSDLAGCSQPKVENRSCSSCQESWTCSDWSSCQNGIQTRTCADQRACGTTISKPTLQQSCSVGSSAPVQSSTEGSTPQTPTPQARSYQSPTYSPPSLQQPASPTPLKQETFLSKLWSSYRIEVIAIPSGLILLIIIILIIVGYIKSHRPASNLQELEDWIRKEKQMGTPEEQIRLALKTTEWKENEVNAAWQAISVQ